MRNSLLKEVVAILIEHAKSSGTITYGELSNRLNGAVSPRGFYQPLVDISECADRNGYPKLSALVVNSETRIPGRGFFVNFAAGVPENKWVDTWERECMDIFCFNNWDSFLNYF